MTPVREHAYKARADPGSLSNSQKPAETQGWVGAQASWGGARTGLAGELGMGHREQGTWTLLTSVGPSGLEMVQPLDPDSLALWPSRCSRPSAVDPEATPP